MKNKITIITFLLLNNYFSSFSQNIDTNTIKNKQQLSNFGKVPKFNATSIKGINWSNDSIQGKVTIISFWYMGCLPCMKEIKYLNQIQDKFKERKDFIFLSFVPQIESELKQFNDTTKSIFSMLRKTSQASIINYEIIPTCETKKEKDAGNHIRMGPECDNIVKDFSITSYPTILIIDKKNNIRYIKSGFPTDEMISLEIMNEYIINVETLLENNNY